MTTATGRATQTSSAVIIEEHAAFREALACVLRWRAGFGPVAQAGSLAEARDLPLDQTDVVIVGLRRLDGDGPGLVRRLRAACPGARVLALTFGPEQHARAARAGSSAVLDKESPLGDILRVARSLGARTSA